MNRMSAGTPSLPLVLLARMARNSTTESTSNPYKGSTNSMPAKINLRYKNGIVELLTPHT